MSKGILTTISIFAISILVVITAFFILGIEKIALNFWALGSLLFSLAVSLLTMVMLFAKQRNKDRMFYAAGLISAVWFYEIAIVISVLFTKSFINKLESFIILQISINALFFIVVSIIIPVSGRIHDNNAKTLENLQNGEYDKPKRGGL